MSYTFRPATRENIGLLIGLAGPSGSGKTYTAMRLAKGLAGDKPFAIIDTEAGRAKHYADLFRFDHCDLMAPFRPMAYEEAIRAAEGAGYPVIVVDSTSHEHAGEGGLNEWHDEILTERVKRAKDSGDARPEWQLRESYNMLSWIDPKTAHRKMISRLLQVRAHVILCFRAEEKIELKKGANNKTEIVPKQTLAGFKGWIPICEKNLPFELTASFILLPDNPGRPVPIKLQKQHRPFFPEDQPIDEEAGRQLAEWARGGTTTASPPQQQSAAKEGRPSASSQGSAAAPASRPALAAVARMRSTLNYPDEQWDKLIRGTLGGAATVPTATILDEAPDEVLESDVLPFLRKLAGKNPQALDDLARILNTTAA